MSSAEMTIFIGFGVIFAVTQVISQAATMDLWRREKNATGRHAVFPWSLAYYVWMFSTPGWALGDQEALAQLKRQRVFAAVSVVPLILMLATAALTSASS